MLDAVENPRLRRAGSSPRGRPARLSLPGRTPPHPGQFLESRFLKPLGITQTELAQALDVSRRRVNELINGRRGITPDTAVRLAVFFGNDAAFWMHLQVAWDMRNAVRAARAQLRKDVAKGKK
jgi:addiction module HigA family antidote